MARLNHENHLQYCRWYYLKNREKLKRMALLNYYRKNSEKDVKLDEKPINKKKI